MKKLLLVTCFIVFFQSAKSQSVSFALSLGLPQNEFRQNTDATGFGADLSLAFPFQKGVPISFGMDFNYLVYGRNSQTETLEAQITLTNGTPIGDPLIIPLEIINTNSIFGTHAFIRAQAPFSTVQPYVEGLVGFRYISTSTKILDNSDDDRFSDEDSNVIVRSTVLDDWIFSYGYGGGFMIKVSGNFFVDLRADFFKGQRAQYFDGDDTSAWSVEFSGSAAAFDPENLEKDDLQFETVARESTTDLLMLKLGVTLKF